MTGVFLPIGTVQESVTRETPDREKPIKERGLYASHGDAPTLGAYLSSLLHLLSFPAVLVIAVVGHLLAFYPYPGIIPVMIGLFIGEIVIVGAVMHVTS